MENIIERLLHVPCVEMEYTGTDVLPLFLIGAYNLKILRIAGTEFLSAVPIAKVNLATMRKHRNKLIEITGMAKILNTSKMSATRCEDYYSMLQKGKMVLSRSIANYPHQFITT